MRAFARVICGLTLPWRCWVPLCQWRDPDPCARRTDQTQVARPRPRSCSALRHLHHQRSSGSVPCWHVLEKAFETCLRQTTGLPIFLDRPWVLVSEAWASVQDHAAVWQGLVEQMIISTQTEGPWTGKTRQSDATGWRSSVEAEPPSKSWRNAAISLIGFPRAGVLAVSCLNTGLS